MAPLRVTLPCVAGLLCLLAALAHGGSRKLLQNFSECPYDPLERCDFYFDGYSVTMPVITYAKALSFREPSTDLYPFQRGLESLFLITAVWLRILGHR